VLEKAMESEKFIDHIRKRFVAGLLILIPLGITLFILKFLFNVADGILGPYLAKLFIAVTRRDTYVPGMGMVTGIVVIYLTGLLATNVMGTQILKWWDGFLSKIPLVKSIYTSSKQLTKVFSEGKTSYRRAVFVEWPRKGVRAVGFVTGEIERGGEKLVVVYVPTMPNPTSGFALFFHVDEVFECGMTMEEAVKFVVSSGVVVR
jgi:uncharacterized membrane protein